MNKTPTTTINTVNLGLSKAEVGGSANYLPDGDFEVALEKVIYKPSTNEAAGTDGDMIFIVEYTVQNISFQKPSLDMNGSEIEPVELGEKRNWTANTGQPGKKRTPAQAKNIGRMKQFMFAVTGASGVDEGEAKFLELCEGYKLNPKQYAGIEDPWDRIASLAISEINPFAGLTVGVQVHREETKRLIQVDGKPQHALFPVYDWRAAAGEAAA